MRGMEESLLDANDYGVRFVLVVSRSWLLTFFCCFFYFLCWLLEHQMSV